MVYSSRVLALFLASCIAVITTLFLSLFQSVRSSALLVTLRVEKGEAVVRQADASFPSYAALSEPATAA